MTSGAPTRQRREPFYAGVFGWKAEVSDDPQAGGYGMFMLDGKEVAGTGPLMNEQQPVAWTVYVLVDDADATAAKVKAAGGTVFAEPFDVMDAGRMAIVADPSGGVLGIWQPGTHRGFEVRGPGAATAGRSSTPSNIAERLRLLRVGIRLGPEADVDAGNGVHAVRPQRRGHRGWDGDAGRYARRHAVVLARLLRVR